MKNYLVAILTILLTCAAFTGCEDANEKADRIIAERDAAARQKELELEIEKLKQGNAATSEHDAALDEIRKELAAAKADAQKAREDAEAKAKAAEETLKNAARAQEDARRLAELKEAEKNAKDAASSARAAADHAAELLRQANAAAAKQKNGVTVTGGGGFGNQNNGVTVTGGAGSGTLSFPGQGNGNQGSGGGPMVGKGTIGSAGGTAVAPGNSGSSVTVLPGALGGNVEISVEDVPPPPPVHGKVLCGLKCLPHGTRFNPPAVVKIALPTGHGLAAGSKLEVRYWNDVTLKWFPAPNPKIEAEVLADLQFARATVPHFSSIMLVDEEGAQQIDHLLGGNPGVDDSSTPAPIRIYQTPPRDDRRPNPTGEDDRPRTDDRPRPNEGPESNPGTGNGFDVES